MLPEEKVELDFLLAKCLTNRVKALKAIIATSKVVKSIINFMHLAVLHTEYIVHEVMCVYKRSLSDWDQCFFSQVFYFSFSFRLVD